MGVSKEVRSWLIGLPDDVPPDLVVRPFQEILQSSPMSFSELGRAMDVAHSTVGRWANGDTFPSLWEMAEATGLIDVQLAGLHDRINLARGLLKALMAVREYFTVPGAPRLGRESLEEKKRRAEKEKKFLEAQRLLAEFVKGLSPADEYASTVKRYKQFTARLRRKGVGKFPARQQWLEAHAASEGRKKKKQ